MAPNSKRRKKQLDAYIHKKLKKDRVEKLMQELAQGCGSGAAQGLSGSARALLRSSKCLGKPETRKQRLERERLLLASGLGGGPVSTHDPRPVLLVPVATSTDRPEDAERVDDSASESPSDAESVDGDASSGASVPPAKPPIRTPVTAEDHLPAYTATLQRPWMPERLGLPIHEYESEIVDALHAAHTLVLVGEPGSGKTTQVPQYLYERGWGGQPGCPQAWKRGRILVTQPRRLATISVAHRVADELGLSLAAASVVGYKVRHEDSGTTPDTQVLFVTDGLLLKLIQGDFLLREYAVVVVDEAHERSINTDLLIGLLSRIVRLRAHMHDTWSEGATPPALLKLVIMSATLNTSELVHNERLFPRPAADKDAPLVPRVIHIPSRQHAVTIHHSRRTPRDYLDAAYHKVCQIHERLPLPGNILVFVTGQAEVWRLVQRLRLRFGGASDAMSPSVDDDVAAAAFDVDQADVAEAREADGAALDDTGPADSDAEDDDLLCSDAHAAAARLTVLPLYSMLPLAEQMKAFRADAGPAATSTRCCIVATNVAETSLTLPGIAYVVDTGRAKQKRYGGACVADANVDAPQMGYIERYDIDWITKAAATQRAGRCGRVGPGHAYRLYSAAIYHELMRDHAVPELERSPKEPVILYMKGLGIDRVVDFPWPTPPADRRAWRAAELRLVALGALAVRPAAGPVCATDITDLGRRMSVFPCAPRHAKMLVLAATQALSLLPHVLHLVSVLSAAGDPLVAAAPLGAMHHGGSDALRLLCLFGAYLHERSAARRADLCRRYGCHEKPLAEACLLHAQLQAVLRRHWLPRTRDDGAAMPLDAHGPPSEAQGRAIVRLYLLAHADHVARRCDAPYLGPGAAIYTYDTLQLRSDVTEDLLRRPVHAWYTLRRGCTSTTDAAGRRTVSLVVIHKGSVLGRGRAVPPRWLVYETLETAGMAVDGGHGRAGDAPTTSKVWMKMCSALSLDADDDALDADTVRALGPLCQFSKPLEAPAPFYDAAQDGLYCWAQPTMAAAPAWALSPALIPFPAATGPGQAVRTKWFAKCLLDGDVVPSLQKYKTLLKPYSLVKVVALVAALGHAGVGSRAALAQACAANRQFLLRELLPWYVPDVHQDLAQHWPPP